MPPAPGMPCGEPVSRRTILRAGTAVGLAALVGSALGGCRVRLQDDAPSIPFLQRRSIPDERLLIDGYHRASALQQLAGRVPRADALLTQLGGIHGTQAQVLHGLLTAGGVPEHVVAAAGPSTGASGSATPAPAVSAPGPATTTDLARREQDAAAAPALAELAAATSGNRVLLTAVASQQAFAALLLGAPPTWPPAGPLPAGALTGAVEASRAVAYAFEVVAAQLAGTERARALATLALVESRVSEQVAMAGPAAPPDPLGYALPFPVGTPDAALRLATVVLGRVVAGGLDPLSTLPPGSPAVGHVVRWQVSAQQLLQQWGGPLLPFPGMTYP